MGHSKIQFFCVCYWCIFFYQLLHKSWFLCKSSVVYSVQFISIIVVEQYKFLVACSSYFTFMSNQLHFYVFGIIEMYLFLTNKHSKGMSFNFSMVLKIFLQPSVVLLASFRMPVAKSVTILCNNKCRSTCKWFIRITSETCGIIFLANLKTSYNKISVNFLREICWTVLMKSIHRYPLIRKNIKIPSDIVHLLTVPRWQMSSVMRCPC